MKKIGSGVGTALGIASRYDSLQYWCANCNASRDPDTVCFHSFAALASPQGQSFDEDDIEVEARGRRLRRVGRLASGAETALGIASRYANCTLERVIFYSPGLMLPSSFAAFAAPQGRSYDDLEVSLDARDFDDLDERDIEDLLELYARKVEMEDLD